MDEVLLRRLVGAVVLVGAALVLAALLPDPVVMPAGSGRVVTYDLRTGERLGARPPSAAETPAASALKADSAGREPSRPVPATAEPVVASPTSLPDPAPADAAEPSGWYVQVGSFGSQSNAKSVLQHLYGAGEPAHLQAVQVGKGYWFRVRVGPYPDEAKAKSVLGKLARQGFRGGKVVHAQDAPAGSPK